MVIIEISRKCDGNYWNFQEFYELKKSKILVLLLFIES